MVDKCSNTVASSCSTYCCAGVDVVFFVNANVSAVCRLLYLEGLLENSLPGPNTDPARLDRRTEQFGALQPKGCAPGHLSKVQRTQTNCMPSTVQYPKGVLALYSTCHTVADVLLCPVSMYHNCELPSM